MTRSRVLHIITTSDVGGAESFLFRLVTGLDARRVESIVVSLCSLGAAGEELIGSGVAVHSLEMSERPRVREMVAAVRLLANMIDRHSIDLVHSILYRANALVPLAARWARHRPIVVAGQRSLTPLRGRYADLSVRATRRLCDRIVAVSEAVRQDLVERERLAGDRVVVIPNGVDTSRFHVTSGAERRKQLGLEPDALVVGSVGRLSPEKGVHHLLDAVARLRERGVTVKVIVVGDGPQRAELEEQSRRLRLERAVTLLGFCGNLENIYPAMDVFVLPSSEEGLSNALLEAMASGVASVATAVGGTPEVIRHGENGLLIPHGDPDALTNALEMLLRTPSVRSRLAQNARRRVESDFSIGRMTREYERLFEDLVNQSRQA